MAVAVSELGLAGAGPEIGCASLSGADQERDRCTGRASADEC
jgi:hypothetical protein